MSRRSPVVVDSKKSYASYVYMVIADTVPRLTRSDTVNAGLGIYIEILLWSDARH